MFSMKRKVLGGVFGFAVGLILEKLLEYGIDSSDAFSLVSAFILFPSILLVGLPWNLLIW
jgi:hypothetical protein